MKKLYLTLLLSLIFFHFTYVSDGPQIWTTSAGTLGQIWALAINPVSQQTIYAGSNTTGIWKTTNGGLTWTASNTGLTNLTVQALAISPSNPSVLYAGTSQTGAGAGIYKSTDAGATWTQVNSGIVETSIGIQSIVIDPTNINIAYVAVFDGVTDAVQGLYKTTNGGTLWVPANIGIGAIKNILSLAINPLNPNMLYCGTSFNIITQMGPVKIYKTNNAAGSWVDMSNGIPQLPTDNKPIRAFSISNADTSVVLAALFVNTDSLSGMYVTTNGGGLWTRRHTGLPNAVGTLPRSCVIRPGSSTEFYVGLGNATNTNIGVFRTMNAGLSWTSFNGGTMLNTTTVRALAFRTTSDSTLYAGGAHPTLPTGQGVFEYSFVITGIGNNNENTPDRYILNQNYPNPFNPSTNIKFNIPKSGFVKLDVYDITGKAVKTLIENNLSMGEYEVTFEARNLPSGIYLYKLTAEQFTDTKTMVLVK